MNVVHVTMHYFPVGYGGQDVYIQQLNDVLEAAGHRVTVIQPGRKNMAGLPANVVTTPQVRYLPRHYPTLPWYWFNAMLRGRRRELRAADVVVCHYPFHYGAVAWHPGTVVLSHGVDWSEPPDSTFNRYKKHMALRAARDGTGIVANDTHFLRAIGLAIDPATRAYERVNERAWYIPNCIDTEAFYDEGLPREKEILVPRNIRKYRGIHLAIEAFRLLAEELPEYRMTVVGGPQRGPYYERCVTRIREAGLQDRIHFAGSVHNSGMRALYNRAEISLIPTIAFEGTSLSALESMACGTPVVATNVAGLMDLPAVKVDLAPESIAEGIRDVLERRSAEAARQRAAVRDGFNRNRWSEAWLSALEAAARR